MRSVLICDHDPGVMIDLKGVLLGLGFEKILECVDGRNAVDKALAALPDVALLDVAMPGMDGFTAAAAIRKKLKIPVILLSSFLDIRNIKRATEIGVAAFLTKPLRGQDVLPAIELAMAHSSEVEELKEKIDDLTEMIENRKVIEKAKGMLMIKNRLNEPEAYRAMQKMAMDKRKSLRQVADLILRTE